MSSVAAPVIESAVVAYLSEVFGHRLPQDVVGEFARDAISDLRGSICTEAIPEMASRLAQVRLRTHLDELS